MAKLVTDQRIITFTKAISDDAEGTPVVDEDQMADIVREIAEAFASENIVVELVSLDG